MKILAIIIFIFSVFQTSEVAFSKDSFSPAILVDDLIITNYELNQRELFFKFLNFPGDHRKEAIKSLIEDRLKERAAKKFGIEINLEALDFEMTTFAGRANLNINQFTQRLEQAGIDRVTWENYMKIPILWFGTVNRKFASEFSATSQNSLNDTQFLAKPEAQVLLTEIIVPTKSGTEEKANEIVKKLREITTLEKFSAAAYKYSAAPTRELGGKITWQNISNLPSAVKPLISGLSIGEVSAPLPIPGGIALFQLRDIREEKYKIQQSEFIDFIQIDFKKNSKLENNLLANVFVCEDLYSVFNKFKKTKIIRKNAKTNSLPKSIQKLLAKMDKNEFVISEAENRNSRLTMVCQRREMNSMSKEKMQEINQQITNKKLYSLANSYIANLRQEATITYK